MSHDDFAFEPVKGLPERPPEHEHILWQGRPDTWALAVEAYKINWISAYFAVIVLWRAGVGAAESGGAGAFAFGLPYAILWAMAFAVVLLLAWVQARATVYTITTARVAMRIGAALTVTLNLPFRQIANADLKLRKNGTGTIALETLGETQFSYLVLWPHLRPGHVKVTKPALRCIPDAAKVAGILAEAAEARISQPVIERKTAPQGDLVAAE
ncbi:MAG: putative photosynthetic complex assembly protein [Roseibaca calidilacus]|uniref:PH domain-containing protein n=1 Tax=Roseibaca calidilacus TaxID=1666912 RepID=A0A0P7WWN4_9RHOB|nr:photosynthetic complex putative assembly protein PuhB [Roseibaca calidilacus]KPP95685.1 MAG: putative photosynthetic complex assembly protein [Roseibaca calidilacus]CUX81886.1 PH domain-containing protein [Roseibaca calidilacus]